MRLKHLSEQYGFSLKGISNINNILLLFLFSIVGY